MDGTRRKPKLVFFQWDHRPNATAASYLLLHMQQHVKCLATHFEVVVVNQDCDYAEICDRHEPDLTLFESGYRSHGSRRVKVVNTGAHAGIPKLGLHNGDPWCDRRAGFISDMEGWSIETYFSISTLAPQYMPALGENLFIWPNFIDPALYRDYGQHKTIPVTLTGQVYGLYPWRQAIFPLIRERYPCLVSPQYAYESEHALRLLSGEAYARVLNASHIVPTCGTMGGEIIRKQFEIPGCKACLLTEKTESLVAAGFADMENCVFADPSDVAERLDYLFAHPDDMGRISEAGHDLVHSRHTLEHRPQIYEWFRLHEKLKPDEKIVQLGPFGSLAKVDRAACQGTIHIVGAPRDRTLLREGDLHLAQDRLEEAKACYARCLNYVSYLPEARFGLALCALREGDPGRASILLADLIKTTITDYGATDPDPVEWAYFLLAMICNDQLAQARKLLDFYPQLSHRELRRVRLILDRGAAVRSNSAQFGRDRKSIHRLLERSDSQWIAWFADILDRCGRHDLAKEIGREGPKTTHRAPMAQHSAPGRPSWRAMFYAGVDRLLIVFRLDGVRPNVPPMPEFQYFGRLVRSLVPPSQRIRLRKTWIALGAFFARMQNACHDRRERTSSLAQLNAGGRQTIRPDAPQ